MEIWLIYAAFYAVAFLLMELLGERRFLLLLKILYCVGYTIIVVGWVVFNWHHIFYGH